MAEQTTDGTQPLALSTAGKKGAVDGAKVTLSIVFVIGVLRGLGLVKWDPNHDAEVAGAIIVLGPAVGGLMGSAWNLIKNRKLAKNGVSMTRTIAPLIIMALMLSSCAITTPKGVYSLALTGDQVGFAKDVVAQVGNLYQEIVAQEAALEEAQKAGKTDRVAAILEKIANLKAKAAEKGTVVQEQIDAAEEALEAGQ